MRLTSHSRPVAPRCSAKARAARIGPTVWELDGPIPMEKRSRAEKYANERAGCGASPQPRAGVAAAVAPEPSVTRADIRPSPPRELGEATRHGEAGATT